MEFNRLITLILGFAVLILVFVWITNRLKPKEPSTTTQRPTITITPIPTKKAEKWNPLGFLFGQKNTTPTPTPNKTQTTSQNNTFINTTTSGITGQLEQLPDGPKPNKVTIIENSNLSYTTNGSNPTNGTKKVAPGNTNTQVAVAHVSEIPKTGVPSLLIPFISVIFGGGIYLRKKQ